MKKNLLLASVIALGVSVGISGEVSANEAKHNVEEVSQKATLYSVYDNAPELQYGVHVKASTNRYNPIHYYKFYFTGSGSSAAVLFHSEGNHKINILDGNLIQVASGEYMSDVSNLTWGWNYIEVIETAPGNVPNQPYELAIGW